jgi:endo-1,4-beta-mannosidase
MEFDLVSESPAFNYVEGKEMENTRDLKMRVLLEDDPTAIKIEQLKNFLNETSIKHINLPSLNLINSSENLKSWVIRNHKYLFDFKSGDLDKDIEFFQLVLSIHNFKLSSLNSRYYFNSTLEEHPFYLAKIKKN